MPDIDEFNCGDILGAVRYILRVGEAQSILKRVVTVMRRYDAMRRELKRDFPDETL